MAALRETTPVRSGEELPLHVLAAYLRQHIGDLPDGDLSVEQFSAGHSNLTYLLKCGQWEGVLRRPPMGPVAPKAHDMAREHRWLQSLHPLFPLAPKPYVFCEDKDLIGAPFFVMERRTGVVVDRAWPEIYPSTSENAVKLAEALVDALATLHHVEYKGTSIEQMVHPEGYLERQVQGLVYRYGLAKTHELPEADEVGRWMVENLPQSPEPTVIHNDLKLNNMLFDAHDAGKAVAVLDWEMSTVGDPLSDLAILLSYWCEEQEPPVFRTLISPLTTLPGFPTRDELIHMYALKSGRNVDNMKYYLVFGYFKAAVICQQIYYRFANGQTQDDRFKMLGVAADGLVQRAHSAAFE